MEYNYFKEHLKIGPKFKTSLTMTLECRYNLLFYYCHEQKSN